ncbi:S1 family peptidase [Lentzea sp. BCCO 10_0061]|uniref:S1 family peptidase n=1 Tax=Lentzea sokolovensis TaxID=3095429 RepID=A0ABU4USL9_9PSEU|nr:S1 family peptidase [Lentzea sp. BCCO 10_0061]MDX8141798.1 S1 family peptidase [Lentzea sp. BCCO 10_0061]
MRSFPAALKLVSIAALAAGFVTAPAAQADVSTLETRLGSSAAGSYVDDSGRLVVTVTDQAALATVTASGARARLVQHSAATLDASAAVLARTAKIPGTSWGTDPVANQVVVSADTTVTGASLARLKAVVAGLGSTARLEQVPGSFTTTIAGGDAILGGGVRCSLGFNVKRPGTSTAYLLTAGHCGNLTSTWSTSGGQVIASRTGTSFPGNDYALFQYTSDISRPGEVNLYNGTRRSIDSAGNPVVGQTVGRSGSTTGFHRGKVTGLNVTVNYVDGTTVTGMIATTVCVQGGDSGGPLFANNTALGLTSGGSGDCTSGGRSFYQPVTEALNAYGVTVY